MARTRATKGRPRPPSRNTITKVISKRGSTVESLRASITSIEEDGNEGEDAPIPRPKGQAPDAGGCLRDRNEKEENTAKTNQDDNDMVEVTEVAVLPKKCNQKPISRASATKKHKSSSPSSTTRTTRSKTLISRFKPDSIHSDSESECESNTGHTTTKNTDRHQKFPGRDAKVKVPPINPSLDLLRPYLTFQLSVSGLKGEAYKAAQASMASILDVAERLEQGGSVSLARTHDSLGSSNEEREKETGQGKGASRREKEVKKFGRRTDEDVLPRKQRELNEQTRKRLERQRNKRKRTDRSRDRESVSH